MRLSITFRTTGSTSDKALSSFADAEVTIFDNAFIEQDIMPLSRADDNISLIRPIIWDIVTLIAPRASGFIAGTFSANKSRAPCLIYV